MGTSGKHFETKLGRVILGLYDGCPQIKFPSLPTAITPFIAWSDCMYVIE